MKMLKNRSVRLAIAIAAIAVVLDFKASTFPLKSRTIDITESGKTVSKDIIEVPPAARVLKLVALAFYGLATSIFISVLVTEKLEAKRHGEHQRELDALNSAININVFDSLFKTVMPEEVYTAFKNDVIMCKLIRRNFEWIYDFSYENDGHTICLKQTLKYVFSNSSTTDINDPIVARTEQATKSFPDADVLERVSCVIDGKQIVAFSRGEKDDGVTERVDSDGLKETVINFTVPAHKEVDVTIIWKQKYNNCNDCSPCRDAYFTKYPIINGQLTVNRPKDLSFSLFQSMSTELQLTSDEPDRLMYKADGAILPRQGFVYIFGPNKAPAADAASAGAPTSPPLST